MHPSNSALKPGELKGFISRLAPIKSYHVGPGIGYARRRFWYLSRARSIRIGKKLLPQAD